MKMNTNTTMLTITEASDGRFHNVKECAIRKWIKSGDLPAVKTGKKYLINESVLITFLTTGNTENHGNEPVCGQIRPLYGNN